MTIDTYRSDGISVSEDSDENKGIFRLFEEDTEIFTRAFPRQKKPRAEGWLENLWSFEDILEISQFTYNNWGIALGQQIKSGHTVVVDKEAGGEIPKLVQQLLTDHAIAVWDSPHGGRNYLLIVSEETYNLLDSFKTKVYITEGGGHDLELLTSAHALVPPSRINHALCDNSKDGCDGEGVSSYSLINTDSIQKTDLQTVRRLIDLLPVEEADESNTTQDSEGRNEPEDFELEELPENFDIEQHFRENIAYFDGNMDDGKSHFQQFFHELITNQSRIRDKWFTNPEDKSVNELNLAIDLAWYLQGDITTIQYIFEEVLPAYREKTLKYHTNKHHRQDILNVDKNTSPPYWVKGLSFNFRTQMARYFHENEEVETKELYDALIYNIDTADNYSEKHIGRGLELFEELELIEEESSGVYMNKNINTEYIEELTRLNEEEDYRPIQYPTND